MAITDKWVDLSPAELRAKADKFLDKAIALEEQGKHSFVERALNAAEAAEALAVDREREQAA